MTDENCIFCKIANGEIPSKTLYEDEQFRVILDLGPATKGHALILPKSHYKNLYELPDATAADVMKLAKKMAGQTVFHFHMHLIPRYEGDNPHILWKPTEVTQDELEEIRKQITE